jgi:hypothetical protein
MDIYEPHRKNFFYCIYSALHTNGSYPIVACVFVVAGYVYRVVIQQRVYMSQYFWFMWPDCTFTVQKIMFYIK